MRVIEVREEHVVCWVQIILEELTRDLDVDLRHAVIVPIVAIAGVGARKTRIGQVLGSQLIARVSGQHECVGEVSVEEGREASLTRAL